jgi:hypothetical protein
VRKRKRPADDRVHVGDSCGVDGGGTKVSRWWEAVKKKTVSLVQLTLSHAIAFFNGGSLFVNRLNIYFRRHLENAK